MTRTSGRSAFAATAMPEISPPPPTPGDDRAHVRALLEDLQRDGALAGDHVRVVERVDEAPHRSARRTPAAATSASSTVLPTNSTVRAVPLGGRHLRQRRAHRHEDGGRRCRAGRRRARRPGRGCRRWPRPRRGRAPRSLSRAIRTYAPRTLYEPARCRFSHFSQTGPPSVGGQRAGRLERRVPDDAGRAARGRPRRRPARRAGVMARSSHPRRRAAARTRPRASGPDRCAPPAPGRSAPPTSPARTWRPPAAPC